LRARVLEVPRLVPRGLARDEEPPLRVEPPAGERGESRAPGRAEPLDRVEVDPELHLRRDLVDVLAAGPRRAHGAHRQRVGGHADGFGDDDGLAHGVIVASIIPGMNLAEWRRLTAVARGQAPADLYVRGGTLLNVYTGELYPANVAVVGERVAYVGPREDMVGEIGRASCRERVWGEGVGG